MKLDLKAIGFNLTPSLKVYAETKLGGLAKFVKRFDASGEAEIWAELMRTTRHHRKGQVYKASADLRLPKKILVAAEENLDVRAAIDGLKNKLRLEIEKYKTKHIEADRRRSKNAVRS